jgi:hypothetical protein
VLCRLPAEVAARWSWHAILHHGGAETEAAAADTGSSQTTRGNV